MSAGDALGGRRPTWPNNRREWVRLFDAASEIFAIVRDGGCLCRASIQGGTLSDLARATERLQQSGAVDEMRREVAP